MPKGILKLQILSIQSEYFHPKFHTFRMEAGQCKFEAKIAAFCEELKFGDIYFPVSDHLSLFLMENEETDTRYGYFNLPLTKLYEYPKKKHGININAVWREKEDNKILEGQSALIKLNVYFLEDVSARFQILVQEAELTRDTEAVGKMDPFVDCKVGDISSQTTVKDSAGKNPVWNQILPFTLESIPATIQFVIKDKDMVSDDIVGSVKINPHEEKLFIDQKEPIDRKFTLKFEDKEAGTLKVQTTFLLNL